MSLSNQINLLQRVLDELMEKERDTVRQAHKRVMRELTQEVEEFDERLTFDRWIQSECATQNTHKDQIEKEFWSMGGQTIKWRCVEKKTPDDVFCYAAGGGIRCVQLSKTQVALCY